MNACAFIHVCILMCVTDMVKYLHLFLQINEFHTDMCVCVLDFNSVFVCLCVFVLVCMCVIVRFSQTFPKVNTAS